MNGKNAERTGQDGTSDDGKRCIILINIHENVSRALVPLLTGQLEVLVDDISIVLKATEVTLVGAILCVVVCDVTLFDNTECEQCNPQC